MRAYPALVDEGETVAVRLCETESDQDLEMWDGTRRLLRLTVPLSLNGIVGGLTNADRLALTTGPYASAAGLIDDAVVAALDELMGDAGGPAWDATGFDRLREQVRSGLGARVADILGAVARVLRASREVDARLERGSGPERAAAVADVVAQRDALVYDGFVTGIGAARLADVERYLRAMAVRLDKQPEAPGRDRQRMATVHALQERYDRLFDGLAPGAPPSEEVVAIAWMLEELRVSLFAQSLGTPGPISEKRVLDAISAAAEAARRSG